MPKAKPRREKENPTLRKKIDYEHLLSGANSSSELKAIFEQMIAEATGLRLIPSPIVEDAHELFFVGLEGVEQSFFVFQNETDARRFQCNGSNENEVFKMRADGVVYFMPFATFH